MKLLDKDAERMVFLLTRREHYLLRFLFRVARRTRRARAALSRDSADAIDESTAAGFADTMAAHHDDARSSAERWLKDPAHCVRGRGGSFGLTLAAGETETFLQAVNAARVGAWESLGSPDFEMGEAIAPPAQANIRAIVAMQLAEHFVAELLRALHEKD